MKALLLSGYGPIEKNVALGEVPTPSPAASDVLIDVHAVSINPIDFKIVQGQLKLIQKLNLPASLGFDASGIVSAIGSAVRRFKIGDAVYARSDRRRLGAFAEQVALDESWVAHKPNSISFVEAASLPLVGLTTLQALKDRAQAKAGQSILIHAGSGGVGTFAIQYAKSLGLVVTTTTSSRNADFVKTLGADDAICYDHEDYLLRPDRYDIVFDALGEHYTLDAFRVISHGGTVVSVAGPPDRAMADQVGAGWLVRLAMNVMGRRIYRAARQRNARYYRFLTESNGEQLAEIAQLVDSKAIKPVIDRIFSFDQIVEAMLYAARGRARGKVVVQLR